MGYSTHVQLLRGQNLAIPFAASLESTNNLEISIRAFIAFLYIVQLTLDVLFCYCRFAVFLIPFVLVVHFCLYRLIRSHLFAFFICSSLCAYDAFIAL